MRTIKAVFSVKEDDYNAGVHFLAGRKTIRWDGLSRKEQVMMLNAWSGMYELFYRFLKDEDESSD